MRGYFIGLFYIIFHIVRRSRMERGKKAKAFHRRGSAFRSKKTRSKRQDVGDFYKAVAHASVCRKESVELQLGEALSCRASPLLKQSTGLL